MLSPEERYGELVASEIPFLRSIALEMDQSVSVIDAHLHRPLFNKVLTHLHDSCYEKLRLYEGIAYADLGTLFTLPRPCLSGLFLKEVGSAEQQAFYHAFLLKHKPRTFFAVTEPGFGSDAVNMKARVKPHPTQAGQFLLNGEKWLFGNAEIGQIGIVLAKSAEGPLGMTGLLVIPDDALQENIERHSLPLAGIRPSRLGYVKYTDYPLGQEAFVGAHVHPIERGTIALVKTFNKMRACICGLALGVSQALLDYIQPQHDAALWRNLQTEVDYYRVLTYDLAHLLVEKPLETAQVSILKYKTTALLERIARQALAWAGPASLIRDPWLAMVCRNAFALEYTDGTTIIQKKNIYQHYQRNPTLFA